VASGEAGRCYRSTLGLRSSLSASTPFQDMRRFSSIHEYEFAQAHPERSIGGRISAKKSTRMSKKNTRATCNHRMVLPTFVENPYSILPSHSTASTDGIHGQAQAAAQASGHERHEADLGSSSSCHSPVSNSERAEKGRKENINTV
jgi:hypothetical protein